MLRTIDQFPAMTPEELPLFKAALELQFGSQALAVHSREQQGGKAITMAEAASLRGVAHALHILNELLELRIKHEALLTHYANLQNTLTILGELDSDQENA